MEEARRKSVRVSGVLGLLCVCWGALGFYSDGLLGGLGFIGLGLGSTRLH